MSLILIFVLFILFLLSAFFSASETAIVSLPRAKVEVRAKHGDRKAKILLKLLNRPEEFFSTILIGNNIANVALASLVSFLATSFLAGNKTVIILFQTILTTTFLVIFGEFFPKSIAFKNNLRLATFFVYPLNFFAKLFFPLVKLFVLLSGVFSKKRIKRSFLSHDELKYLLKTESEFIHDQEALQMVMNIIDFSQKDLRLIMIPRIQLIKINLKDSISDLLELVNKYGYSYIPVFEDREDNLVGIIDVRTVVVTVLKQPQKDLTVSQLISKPLYVSEYSSVGYLLEEFKKSSIKAAFVLDEYGSPIGMITLTDLLREYIEGLSARSNLIERVKRNVFIVQATIAIRELNSLLHLNLEEKSEYITLSGMLLYHFGKIPEEKSRLKLNNLTFIVKKVFKNRIKEVVIIINESSNS